MSIYLEDAQRIIAALNALSLKLEGDKSGDIGLIKMLEQGSVNLHEAAKTFESSTSDIASHILKQGLANRVIELLEADLQIAIRRIGDEASVSSISYLVDKSVLQIMSEAEKIVQVAVDRTWRNTASKQLDHIKEHLAGVQVNFDQMVQKRCQAALKAQQLRAKVKKYQKENERLEQEKGQLILENEDYKQRNQGLEKKRRNLTYAFFGLVSWLPLLFFFLY